jgi:hypothetical protein
MLYLKQIEEDLQELYPKLIGSDTGKYIQIDNVIDYICKLCKANGIDMQYDKISYCTMCDVKPNLIKREEHSGMCGSWVDYYKLECPCCKKSTKECDDWGKDYMTILIKEWNNINK